MENHCKPTLEIVNLSLLINKQSIIENLNLTLYQGEVLLLFGKSGIGKSSLMYAINGYYPNETTELLCDEIKIAGTSVNNMSLVERSQYIHSIFQNARLSFAMATPYEELLFCLENHGIPSEQVAAMIQAQVDLFELQELLHQPFHTLSGGQLQKIAFACATLIDAPLFIMDEPFANIDEESIPFFIKQIQRLKNQGKTFLIIDHRLEYWQWVNRWLFFHDATQMMKIPLPLNSDDQSYLLNQGILYDNSLVERKIPRKTLTFPLLTIENGSIYLPGKKKSLLNHLSLEIYPGDLIALTGLSGAGKSSFFKGLLNVYPMTGRIQLNNNSSTKMKAKDLFKNFGLVFQDPSLQFIKTTVIEELKYSFPDDSYQQLIDLAQQFELHEKFEQSPWLLSQGQQRRLACLTMATSNKKILLIDEPTYGQDNRNTIKIMNSILTLCQNDLAVIFTTHDSRIVEDFANRHWKIVNDTIEEVSYESEY